MTTHSTPSTEQPAAVQVHGAAEGEAHAGSHADGHGTKAIIAALIANIGIAISKFVAYLVTGASSLLAESIHSVADSGNQVLLLVGGKRAARAATPDHPFGYGRDRYIYSFIVAIVLFSVGGLFALYEGYHKLTHPEELTSPQWAIGVLVVAIGLESLSFRTAIKETQAVKPAQQSYWQFIRHARQPELPVILLEDLGALIGLVFALFGVGMTLVTGNGRWDAAGTAMIGLLLVTIAAVLAVEMKSLLLGEGATAEHVRAIEAALPGEGVESVIHMKTLHLGPEELLVAAKVEMAAATVADVAAGINAAEARLRAAVPTARVVYLEPDLYDPV